MAPPETTAWVEATSESRSGAAYEHPAEVGLLYRYDAAATGRFVARSGSSWLDVVNQPSPLSNEQLRPETHPGLARLAAHGAAFGATTYLQSISKVAPVTTATLIWARRFPTEKAAPDRFEDRPPAGIGKLRPKLLVFYGGSGQLNADPLRDEFNRLADEWEDETWAYSFVERKAMNRTYQRIIGQGFQMVPLILERLQSQGPNHWFWALEAITGESPASDAETMSEATDAWLRWGRERGLIE